MAQESKATSILWPQEDLPKNSTLPAMELCLQNPKLLGHDISHFSKLSWRAQANQKALHAKCNCCYAVDIRRLMQLAKKAGIVSTKRGKHGHVSKVVDEHYTLSEIRCLIKVAHTRTNYQCSMILEDIVGVRMGLPQFMMKRLMISWVIYLSVTFYFVITACATAIS